MNGQHYTFDVLGLLDGVFQMLDRQTGTVWTHLDGKAIRGPLIGERLAMVPMPQMTWGEWKAMNPETTVLSQDTPFIDRYRPVRIGMLGRQEEIYSDGRLESNALVVGVEVDGLFKGYPIDELQAVGGVTNDVLAELPVVAFYDAVARTGMAYSRVVNGEAIEFYNASATGFELRDRGTDSLWDLSGKAVEGPLAGTSLTYVSSFISEWYGWSAYHPETAIYEGDS